MSSSINYSKVYEWFWHQWNFITICFWNQFLTFINNGFRTLKGPGFVVKCSKEQSVQLHKNNQKRLLAVLVLLINEISLWSHFRAIQSPNPPFKSKSGPAGRPNPTGHDVNYLSAVGDQGWKAFCAKAIEAAFVFLHTSSLRRSSYVSETESFRASVSN